MARLTRVAMTLAVLSGAVAPAVAQDTSQGRSAYLRAVADFFQVSPDEIAILADWDLPAQEIPVALFVAERAGVSPDAVVALRRSGSSWAEVARRYHIDAAHFHVPLPGDVDAGVLSRAYDRYRSLPPREWRTVMLGDGEIITLVNLRLISQTLQVPADEVLVLAPSDESWVQVYAGLLRDPALPHPLP